MPSRKKRLTNPSHSISYGFHYIYTFQAFPILLFAHVDQWRPSMSSSLFWSLPAVQCLPGRQCDESFVRMSSSEMHSGTGWLSFAANPAHLPGTNLGSGISDLGFGSTSYLLPVPTRARPQDSICQIEHVSSGRQEASHSLHVPGSFPYIAYSTRQIRSSRPPQFEALTPPIPPSPHPQRRLPELRRREAHSPSGRRPRRLHRQCGGCLLPGQPQAHPPRARQRHRVCGKVFRDHHGPTCRGRHHRSAATCTLAMEAPDRLTG